jgi:GTP pyrophosphokinase
MSDLSDIEMLEDMYKKLEQAIRAYNQNINLTRVREAYDCAFNAHAGQKRKDGSPYVSHVLAAATIAAEEMNLDEDSIVAALLHDCIEDTDMTHDDIAKQFGVQVADIVEGVSKLTRVQYTSKEDEQMENLRKMLMAMSKDIRVILIKIADRLHNMRTMEYQSPDKQYIKSKETLEIYAPIAHRLGMQRVKWELEDLSLKYIDPEAYKAINDKLDVRREQNERFMAATEKRIKERMDDWHIECTISSRLKHIYSIYRKMYSQKLDLEEIFDLCAFRVIVNTIPDCYNVLGHIHDMFKPVPGRFKDYIGTPKPNGYQSIHTTVIGPEVIPFEVQIRTWDMHRTAEYGVAAHWKYKSGTAGVKEGDEDRFAWVRRLLESQQESDAQDFFHDLQVDMFADQVFVFTPKGDIINLPAGATPIDFAYSIHSAVGNSMIGAKVNGRIVPFSHQLQNGDIVDVLTSKSAPGPSRDWLKLAKSGSARTKIKQWFKKEKREENVMHGRDMFEEEFRRAGFTLSDLTDEEVISAILKKMSFTSMDDMFAAIGYGGITAVRAVNRAKEEIIKAQKPKVKTLVEKLGEPQVDKKPQKSEKAVHGVLVEGLDNCLIKFSRCCTPVPGDEIVGFITRGYGVSVHRRDCENYKRSLENDDEAGRWIKVGWADVTTDLYQTTLTISSRERSGLVMDIATALNSLSAKVKSLSARDTDAGRSIVHVTLEVPNLDDLHGIMRKLSGINGVIEITRGGAM